MSYPIDDAEQLIANAEAQMPPSIRSRLIAKLRMGKHVDDAAAELEVSPKLVFSTARLLTAFGEQLDATLQGESGQKHSPRTSTFVDNLKGLWGRIKA